MSPVTFLDNRVLPEYSGHDFLSDSETDNDFLNLGHEKVVVFFDDSLVILEWQVPPGGNRNFWYAAKPFNGWAVSQTGATNRYAHKNFWYSRTTEPRM